MVLEPMDNDGEERVRFFRAPTQREVADIACGLASFIMGALIVSLVVFLPWPNNNDANNFNESTAASVDNVVGFYSKIINEKFQPCEDFYGFVCSKLVSNYEKQKRSIYDTFSVMETKALEKLLDILSKPSSVSDTKVFEDTKSFFQKCVRDQTTIDDEAQSVIKLLKRLGGWPIIDHKWEENMENYIDVVGSMNRLGFEASFPFQLNLKTNPYDPSRTIISLEPFLESKKSILNKDNSTFMYVHSIATYLNATTSARNIYDDVKDCIGFETELSNITNSAIKDIKRYSVNSLASDFPEFSWKNYFTAIFASTSVSIQSKESVLIEKTEYLPKVKILLQMTPIKVLRNYLFLRMLHEGMAVMPIEFRNAKFQYENLSGPEARTYQCLQILYDKASIATGYMYIRSLNRTIKVEAERIFSKVKDEALSYIKKADCMDIKVKERILMNLKNLKKIIGYDESQIVESKFEKFTIRSNDSLFSNYKYISKYFLRMKLESFRIPEKNKQWVAPLQFAMRTNVYYSRLSNTIVIMAALLQPPVFDVGQPSYLNFGGLGFVMGHEIGHPMKIPYICKNCNSTVEFKKRLNCFISRYDNHMLARVMKKVNGSLTLPENVADVMGLKLAYSSFDTWLSENGKPEKSIPGLNYTARQMFWVNAAMELCGYQDEETSRYYLASDTHSPPEVRVNTGFPILKEFLQDFECTGQLNAESSNNCVFT